jgi:hypothetical protein
MTNAWLRRLTLVWRVESGLLSVFFSLFVRRVWRYQRGNQNPYIEEEQTTQWPKEKVQMDKQRSTKHTHQTKDRVTRTPLKLWSLLPSCREYKWIVSTIKTYIFMLVCPYWPIIVTETSIVQSWMQVLCEETLLDMLKITNVLLNTEWFCHDVSYIKTFVRAWMNFNVNSKVR